MSQIETNAAIKIQKQYRRHLNFLVLCKNLDKNFTKKCLVNCIFYGLHLDFNGIYHSLGPYLYAYELRYVIHQLSQYILYNNADLEITPEQVKKILTVFTKDQLLCLGFGLDEKRLK